jgi:hypothetical protein
MWKRQQIFTHLAVLGLTLGLLAGPIFAQGSESTTNQSSATAKSRTKSKKHSSKAKTKAASKKSRASSKTVTARTHSRSRMHSKKAKTRTVAANSRASSPAQRTRASNRGLVWVNPDTKIFHRTGDHWYGKTKNGKYMTEAEAIKEGYHAAKHGGRRKSQH